jgi:hypothetical protein
MITLLLNSIYLSINEIFSPPQRLYIESIELYQIFWVPQCIILGLSYPISPLNHSL